MAKLKESQTDEFAARVRNRIQSQRLEAGTFLMTEADLAGEYGVSRKVVREAIGKLQAIGVVHSRRRKGIFVGKPDPVKLLAESVPSLVSSEADFVDLGRLRYALELGAIELAVRSASESQIARLGEVEAEMEKVLREGSQHERFIELDIQYHSLILEMTGSRMIAGMQRVLVDFFAAARRDEMDAPAAERILWEHRTLYQAIRNRESESARSFLRMQLIWLLELRTSSSE